MKIHLKKGEKLYLNGAVLQVEQRCSVRLLNNATFLLENHVMQSDMASTPLKQLYFVIQTLLIDPESEAMTRQIYWRLSDSLRALPEHPDLIQSLDSVDQLIKIARYFDALKSVRELLKIEKQAIKTLQVSEISFSAQEAIA
jgi:flagellar biosynthesis repressor protein FlbT